MDAAFGPAPAEARASVQIDCEVAIVGAGFAGLTAAVELLEAGRRSFTVLERAGEPGGVWRDNVYPGCACDIRSNLYSIAARPNPGWVANYADRAEIFAYLKSVAGEPELAARIRYGCEVVEARYLDQENAWRLTLQTGEVRHARVVVLALGPLNRPKAPAIAGLESFSGAVVHSSAWDPALDLAGKRVAVIGTGASGVQIVPNLAGRVAHLTVYQRSAPWVLPRSHRRTSALERWLYRRAPALQALVRGAVYWAMEGVGSAFFGSRVVNRALTAIARRKLGREVRDPVLRRALTPDYAIGCKRMTVSDDYLPAFNRRDVELVSEPIVEVTPGGVRTGDGRERPTDHIVLATGFVVADPDDYLRVVGRGGRVLAELWATEGAQAYRGISIAGFPNLAMLLGPNSGLSYASAIHIVESQTAYLLLFLEALEQAGDGAALDARGEVQDAYNVDLQAALSGSVWASGCQSWYLSRSGRNVTIYPGLTSRYRRLMSRFDADAYRIEAPRSA